MPPKSKSKMTSKKVKKPASKNKSKGAGMSAKSKGMSKKPNSKGGKTKAAGRSSSNSRRGKVKNKSQRSKRRSASARSNTGMKDALTPEWPAGVADDAPATEQYDIPEFPEKGFGYPTYPIHAVISALDHNTENQLPSSVIEALYGVPGLYLLIHQKYSSNDKMWEKNSVKEILRLVVLCMRYIRNVGHPNLEITSRNDPGRQISDRLQSHPSYCKWFAMPSDEKKKEGGTQDPSVNAAPTDQKKENRFGADAIGFLYYLLIDLHDEMRGAMDSRSKSSNDPNLLLSSMNDGDGVACPEIRMAEVDFVMEAQEDSKTLIEFIFGGRYRFTYHCPNCHRLMTPKKQDPNKKEKIEPQRQIFMMVLTQEMLKDQVYTIQELVDRYQAKYPLTETKECSGCEKTVAPHVKRNLTVPPPCLVVGLDYFHEDGRKMDNCRLSNIEPFTLSVPSTHRKPRTLKYHPVGVVAHTGKTRRDPNYEAYSYNRAALPFETEKQDLYYRFDVDGVARRIGTIKALNEAVGDNAHIVIYARSRGSRRGSSSTPGWDDIGDKGSGFFNRVLQTAM